MLGSTKIYGCLADPIEHVKAPLIFTNIFREKNIDAVMVPINVSEKNLEKVIPLKRVGQPSDISNSIMFLLSDQANYITGTEIIVDGGITAKP